MGKPQKMGLGGYRGTSGKKLWDDEGKGTSGSEPMGATARPLPNIKYPGNDPAMCPGEGYEWRGRGAVGSKEGSWYKKETGEILRADLHHPPPIPPHWDYTDPRLEPPNEFWVFEGDRVVPKTKWEKKLLLGGN